jgi:cytochrome b6-f complex iron-sulfur subunit
LKYLIGGSVSSVALSLLLTEVSDSREVELEDLCLEFPENSRCQNYFPGVQALDSQGTPIAADALLATAKAGEAVLVEGLPKNHSAYLVITQGPEIAPYAIRPICTHLGCTVKWHEDQNKFICPCHGSQYDYQGRVTRGPAPRSLPLVTVVTKQNQVRLVDRVPANDPRRSN